LVEVANNGRGGVVIHLSASGVFHAATGREREHRHRDTPIGGIRIVDGLHHEWRRLDHRGRRRHRRLVQRAGTFTQVNGGQSPARRRRPHARGSRLASPRSLLRRRQLEPAAAATSRVVGIDRDRAAIDCRSGERSGERAPIARFETASASTSSANRAAPAPTSSSRSPRACRQGRTAIGATGAGSNPLRLVRSGNARARRPHLAGAKYAVDRVQPLDLFPQTEHVETVLERCTRPRRTIY